MSAFSSRFSAIAANFSVECAAGDYMTDTGCQQCGENTFSEKGSSFCTSCPDGQISAPGSSSRNNCSYGKYLILDDDFSNTHCLLLISCC